MVHAKYGGSKKRGTPRDVVVDNNGINSQRSVLFSLFSINEQDSRFKVLYATRFFFLRVSKTETRVSRDKALASMYSCLVVHVL